MGQMTCFKKRKQWNRNRDYHTLTNPVPSNCKTIRKNSQSMFMTEMQNMYLKKILWLEVSKFSINSRSEAEYSILTYIENNK